MTNYLLPNFFRPILTTPSADAFLDSFQADIAAGRLMVPIMAVPTASAGESETLPFQTAALTPETTAAFEETTKILMTEFIGLSAGRRENRMVTIDGLLAGASPVIAPIPSGQNRWQGLYFTDGGTDLESHELHFVNQGQCRIIRLYYEIVYGAKHRHLDVEIGRTRGGIFTSLKRERAYGEIIQPYTIRVQGSHIEGLRHFLGVPLEETLDHMRTALVQQLSLGPADQAKSNKNRVKTQAGWSEDQSDSLEEVSVLIRPQTPDDCGLRPAERTLWNWAQEQTETCQELRNLETYLDDLLLSFLSLGIPPERPLLEDLVMAKKALHFSDIETIRSIKGRMLSQLAHFLEGLESEAAVDLYCRLIRSPFFHLSLSDWVEYILKGGNRPLLVSEKNRERILGELLQIGFTRFRQGNEGSLYELLQSLLPSTVMHLEDTSWLQDHERHELKPLEAYPLRPDIAACWRLLISEIDSQRIYDKASDIMQDWADSAGDEEKELEADMETKAMQVWLSLMLGLERQPISE